MDMGSVLGTILFEVQKILEGPPRSTVKGPLMRPVLIVASTYHKLGAQRKLLQESLWPVSLT